MIAFSWKGLSYVKSFIFELMGTLRTFQYGPINSTRAKNYLYVLQI